MSATAWLSHQLLRSAERRIGFGRSDWARAMAAELEACGTPHGRVRWALGCWRASFRTPGAAVQFAYPFALAACAGLMTAYEWTADEGLVTLLVLAALSVGLGVLKPSRAVISAIVLGLVVSAVLAFEALSGVRPAYETHPVTFAQSLHWTVFVIPALLASMVGGAVAARFQRTGGR